jgi:hypothetical protein
MTNRGCNNDKVDILKLMQKSHTAKEPIIVVRSGKLIFGHEAQSTNGEENKLTHGFLV